VSTRYNYTPTEITILMDNGHYVQPTRHNIVRSSMLLSYAVLTCLQLAAITDLVKDVKDGDHLFFHCAYTPSLSLPVNTTGIDSGHSTQVENERSQSEEDGKDECEFVLVFTYTPLTTAAGLIPWDGEEMKIIDNVRRSSSLNLLTVN
jgi:hypothetical protein